MCYFLKALQDCWFWENGAGNTDAALAYILFSDVMDQI